MVDTDCGELDAGDNDKPLQPKSSGDKMRQNAELKKKEKLIHQKKSFYNVKPDNKA